MSKTGGGPGSNQYGPRGRGKQQVSGSGSASQGEAEDVHLDEQDATGDGSTPVDPDEAQHLTERFSWIKTRAEQNEAEAEGIADARPWAFDLASDRARLLTTSCAQDLHQKMFGHMWNWGGEIRRRETTLGIAPERIREDLAVLLGDTEFWCEHGTYEPTVIGARFHHRLVSIHPFVNGNGRHARLMTTVLGMSIGLDRLHFSWGRREAASREARRRYLEALRSADENDYKPLINMAVR